jgi:adenylylsulfate kinase
VTSPGTPSPAGPGGAHQPAGPPGSGDDAGAAEGVLITGVYGAGKSSVAEEIAYLLEQQGARFALLDLDFLGWAAPGAAGRAGEVAMMLANLSAVAANYRRAGIQLFVLAWFARSAQDVQGVTQALGLPLRVVRLSVPLPVVERRLAGNVTSGRSDDLREAAASLAAGEGAALGDAVISADRPVGVVAREVLAFLGWPGAG